MAGIQFISVGFLLCTAAVTMATKRGKRAAKIVDPEKENATDGAGIIPMPLKKAAVKPKALTVNNMSLEEELETMTKTLKQMSIEKEQSEARLKLKEDELQAKAAEAQRINEQLKLSDEGKKKLEEKLRKLQKQKEFQPTLVSKQYRETLLENALAPVKHLFSYSPLLHS